MAMEKREFDYMSTNLLPSEETVAQNKEISQKAPYLSVKELRKLLGVDAKELDDSFLRNLSVGLGQIALLLVKNPEEFIKLTEIKGVSNYE